MQWLGFGRGFVYSEPDVTFNAWTPAARAASADARKASQAAHAATPKGNLLGRALLGERFTRTSPTYSLSRSAVGSATAAMSSKPTVGSSPGQEHTDAGMMHETVAKELRESGNSKAADLHDKASRLHHEAAKMYK